MGAQTYLIALGSNRRSRFGSQERLLALLMAGDSPLRISASPRETDPSFFTRRRGEAEEEKRLIALSRVVSSSPLGPGKRRYANAVALIESDLAPPALLALFKSIERAHGRRPGRRWGDRVLDLDIIGWSGGIWATRTLSIPHPAFRERRFVLAPLVEVAPDWRDPVTNLAARHLLARLDRRRPRS
ncbi:2-amino-4-hydroxy-6-hydroxymethyldihydropteridine diphosphokinase [Sphingomonas sp. SUN039]|nr:2-amino-4-hydroxy-6-hydroxymethyldihydropteridine diphosphokinase [Sphingomonas sp. SUN039]UVO52992.1 2-amino-4-hydroxy-6-hydroxymethyldihydropteridine diphosphokinase [Sphingomonas sp. SUN039]